MPDAMLYQLNGVEKQFEVGSVPLTALSSVSLELQAGRFIALVGPSGSGKSTLLNILGLLETPSAGRLCFLGEDVGTFSERQCTELRRHCLGFIFQTFNLIPIHTALENVEYALYLQGKLRASEIREKALAALGDVGLARFAGHRPAQLSGGQRQRVAIARALVKDPKVILADEPTANLDSKTADEIMGLLRKLTEARGTTVVLATHDKAAAASADHQIALRDGSIERQSRRDRAASNVAA